MKYVIKAADGSYKRDPGDSLSSRYDDNGYTCYSLEIAVLFTNETSASWGLHEKGKFSAAQGAKVIGVELIDVTNFSDDELILIRSKG